MSFEPRDYLRHILVEANYLVDRSADVTIEAFVADETLRRAFVRSLEIIGEAAKKVPDDFRTAYPEVEWRAAHSTHARPAHSRLLRGRLRTRLGCCSQPDPRTATADRCHTRGLTSQGRCP